MGDDDELGQRDEELLSLRAAAERFGVSTAVLRRLVVRGELPGARKQAKRSGEEWAVPASSVADLVLASGRSGTSPDTGSRAPGRTPLAWAPSRTAPTRRRYAPLALVGLALLVLVGLVGGLAIWSGDDDPQAASASTTGDPTDTEPAESPVATDGAEDDRSEDPVTTAGSEEEPAAPVDPAPDPEPAPEAPVDPPAGPEAAPDDPSAPIDVGVDSEPPEAPQAPAGANGGTVLVEPGDNFWSIAEGLAGSGASAGEVHDTWTALIDANLDVLPEPGNPDLLYVGTVLVIP